MKMKQIKWLGTFILLSLSMALMAENEADKGGTIKGIVVDANSSVPIEYATIAIYDAATNSVITGTVTDVNGSFRIPALTFGRFNVQISFMGYKALKVDNVTVSTDKASYNMGIVKLHADVETLNEVEVVADRKAFEYKIDKKIVNVSGQATTVSMTAVEVLENVPSVKVDVEGNVSLRGSTGFTVLIDGKPTILDASDALRQMPASAIENIEIITNPSAKYQPDGTAGIINIITKKNKSLGVNGQMGLNLGMYGTYGGDLLLNYRHKKINYVLGADFNNRSFPGVSESERCTYSDTDTTYLLSDGDGDRDMQMWGLRGGLEIDISKSNSATLGARYGKRAMDFTSTLDYHKYNSLKTFDDYYSSMESFDRGGDFFSMNGSFLHQFELKGHQLSFQFDYSNRGSDEESMNQLVEAGAIKQMRRSIVDEPGVRGEVKVDYTLPFSETNKLEVGYQGRIEKGDEDNRSEDWDVTTSQWKSDNVYSNAAKEDQKIHALYTMYAGMWKKFGYQAGLRGEYTYRSISNESGLPLTKDVFEIDRMDYFPTLHFSYQLPLEQQIMLSYARRLQRTRGWMLEPAIIWRDAYNVRQGNPDLEPEFIDSYEMAYVKQFKNAYISLEGYHRITHNKVETLQYTWEGDTSGGILMGKPFNVGKDYSTGLELSFNLKTIKWWEMNLMGNLYNYEVTGNALGKDFSNTTFNWGSRMNNTFRFAKNHQIQINGSFNSPTATTQGETEEYYSVDAAYRVDMMKRKLSAVFQVRDVFNTGNRINTTRGDGFYTYSNWGMKSPIVSLSVTYRFNNYMPKRQNNKTGGDEMNGEGGEF